MVAVAVLLVVAAPLVWSALPADDEDVSAVELVERVEASADRGYSGYVETRGTLQLPSADRFTDVGALFGEETRMRVWWRGAEAWRVDKLLVSGETDLIRQDDATAEWSYESAEANFSADPEIRLPRTSDVLPPELGARVLRDADPESVTRLPARRVAGRSALGLQVVPASAQSSIDRAELWADAETGIPLLVEIYVADETGPVFTTSFGDFDADRPSEDDVSFRTPPGVERSFDDVLDIADAANQYAPLRPPPTVGGLESTDVSDGAVGVYGEGLAQLIAIPLRDREADPLREQLRRTIGVVPVRNGTSVAIGPLGVLLTGEDDEGGWLVAGTVTVPTLVAAADDLLAGTTYLEEAP